MNQLKSDLLKTICDNASSIDRNREFPKKNLELLGEAGLMGLLVPSAFGGMEAGASTFTETVREVGKACASTGMVFLMHCCAMEVIAKYHKGKESLLKQAASGKHLSTLACSERGSGANFYASDSTSEKNGDSFLLQGSKAFVTSGSQADSYVVSTRSTESKSCIETSLYLLEKSAKGSAFAGDWQGVGLRGNSSISLELSKCAIPESNLLGNQGQGLEIEMSTILPRFLLGSAAVYNGIAEAALEASLDHVKNRQHSHSGEKLSSLPVLRNKLAQMAVAVDSSVSLMRASADSWDEDRNSTSLLLSLLKAKQLACRTAVDVASLAMETCGGIAYSGTLPLERHLRDAQAGVVMAPSNDILLDLIGKSILDLPLL